MPTIGACHNFLSFSGICRIFATVSFSDLFFDKVQIASFLCGQKAKVSDLNKTLRQDMLQEAPDKFKGIQAAVFEGAAVLIFVPESDTSIPMVQDISV